jgi:hypothetical protein
MNKPIPILTVPVLPALVAAASDRAGVSFL